MARSSAVDGRKARRSGVYLNVRDKAETAIKVTMRPDAVRKRSQAALFILQDGSYHC